MNKLYFFRLFLLIMSVYIIILYIYNIIKTIVLILVLIGTCVIFILTQKFDYTVADNKWRLLATIGSVTTAISLLINANVFIKNEKAQNEQNLINFNKILSDSFGKIEDNFMNKANELGYLYHDIHYSSGHSTNKDLSKTRDRSLEFQQALRIFKAMEVVFIAGNLKNTKDDPKNRGVINLFYMYSSSALMKEYWKTIRYNFSPEFIRFIENEYYNNRISTNKVFVT